MLCCCARRAAAMTYTSLPQRCTHMFSTQMGAPPGRASSMPESDRQLHRGTSSSGGPKAHCSCEEVARRGAGPYLPMIWVIADHAGASRKADRVARAVGEVEQAPDVVHLQRAVEVHESCVVAPPPMKAWSAMDVLSYCRLELPLEPSSRPGLAQWRCRGGLPRRSGGFWFIRRPGFERGRSVPVHRTTRLA